MAVGGIVFVVSGGGGGVAASLGYSYTGGAASYINGIAGYGVTPSLGGGGGTQSHGGGPGGGCANATGGTMLHGGDMSVTCGANRFGGGGGSGYYGGGKATCDVTVAVANQY